jgi:hypothetical protein
MNENIITFAPDGTARCLWTEAVPLAPSESTTAAYACKKLPPTGKSPAPAWSLGGSPLKLYQFYETPPDLAQRMVALATSNPDTGCSNPVLAEERCSSRYPVVFIGRPSS